jgi:hypothetical protein
LKIEYRHRNSPNFSEYSDYARDLSTYSGSETKRGVETITLVPGAKTLVHLASWREDYDFVMPAVNAELDYYEESCSGAVEFRFTVVAFDDHARYITAVGTIRPGR